MYQRTQMDSTHLDVLKEDASTPLVLEGEQLFSMLPLLITVLLEEMGKAWKGHIITGEIEGLEIEVQSY